MMNNDAGRAGEECQGGNDEVTDSNRWLTNGSIRVDPKTCVIHFEPGRTYTRRIKLSNISNRPQIVQITRPPERKIFKFSDPTAFQVSTICPRETLMLQFTFTSHSNQEFKSYLHLKNPTGRRTLLDVELRAIPKMHSRIIHFGNVDIGMSVLRKFSLSPGLNPYQFRIYIPHDLEGLCVNPICGEVLTNCPVDVTVVYTPQSYITLCIDLRLYLSEGYQSPQIITLTAVTKPKINRFAKITERTTTKVIHIPHSILRPFYRNKIQKDTTVFNRLTLNKTLAEKQTHFDNDCIKLCNPLGESSKTWRESYVQEGNDFVVKTNGFDDEPEKAQLDIPSCELVVTDDQMRCVTACEEKSYSYRNVSCDDQSESLESLVRSIHMSNCVKCNDFSVEANRFGDEHKKNLLEIRDDQSESSESLEKIIDMDNCVNASGYDFYSNLNDNWGMRLQTANKFVTAIKEVIIENRMKKRQNGFNASTDFVNGF